MPRFLDRIIVRGNTTNSPLVEYQDANGNVLSQINANGTPSVGQIESSWAASTAFTTGQAALTSGGVHLRCTTAGTTGSTQPTWPTTIGASVTDGTVTWQVLGAGNGAYVPTFLPQPTGGDDTAGVVAAMNAAPSGSTVVFASGGSYTVSTLAPSKALRVVADGATITQKAASSGPILTLGVAGSSVRGGTWDGNSANQTASNPGIAVTADDCTVESLTVQNTAYEGIHGLGCNRLRVDRCQTLNTGYIGIFVESNGTTADIVDTQIVNCLVDRSTIAAASIVEGGLKVHGHAVTSPGRALRTKIVANRVLLPTSPTDGSCICIEATYCPNVVVSNNTTSGGAMGVSAGASDYAVAVGNSCFQPNSYGIELGGSRWSTVTGNQIDGNALTSQGIMLDQSGATNSDSASITGNTVIGCVVYALDIASAIDVTVSGNVFQVSAGNIAALLNNADGFSITGNTFDGLTTAVKAIQVVTSSNGNISGNNMRNFTQDGIQFYATTTYTFSNITISANLIANCTNAIGTQLSGGATVAASVKTLGNIGADDAIDFQNQAKVIAGIYPPNNNYNAGMGSIFLNENTGQVWAKASGAVGTTTGWLATQVQGIGSVTSPAVPASATALANPFSSPATVYVAGGTVSAIAISGVTTGLTSGSFRVPAGGSITLTYTVAPTTFAWVMD